MPLIQLSTTSDLAENADIPDILQSLTEALCEFETISPKTVKAYHFLLANWVVGEGSEPGFANVQVMVLEGRPAELRDQIATKLYSIMEERFQASLKEGLVNLTLEVREMDRPTYRMP